MAYGAEVELSDRHNWELVVLHNGTGVMIQCVVMPTINPPGPTETQTDAVFQGLVDKIASMAGVTLVKTTKQTTYESAVTPT